MPSTDWHGTGGDHGRRRWWWPAATGALLIVVVALTVWLGPAKGRHLLGSVTGRGSHETPTVVDEASIKADLIDALPYAPQVVLLGGSRIMRFEPGYIERKTGRKGFNAGVRNGRPEEAWALTHYIHDRFPDVRSRYLWAISVNFLRSYEHVSPTLVLDPRFKGYFPADFIAAQRALMPGKYLKGKRDITLGDRRRFGADGRVTRERRNWAPDQFEYWADKDIAAWLDKNPAGRSPIDEQPRQYFEKTLGYMNGLGARPLLVLMPVHPRMMKVVADQGWTDARRELKTYLSSLTGRYDFDLVDLSSIDSFDGDPTQFYDSYHPQLPNTHRIVDELLRRHPAAFD